MELPADQSKSPIRSPARREFAMLKINYAILAYKFNVVSLKTAFYFSGDDL